MEDAGLPARLSPHSFRVATITDLVNQAVPLEDVQSLVGQAEPRTTGLHTDGGWREGPKMSLANSSRGFRTLQQQRVNN